MENQNSSISSFKQFALRMLLPMLLLLGAGVMIFNYIFEKKIILNSQISGAYKVNRIINETHPDEIPIFGSSRSIMGLIPDSLGNNYFNYGINGAYYNVTIFFLEEECKKKKKNPYIILNLDPFGLRNGIGDIASYVHNASHPAVKALLDSTYRPYFNIPLMKYFGFYETYYRLYLRDRSDEKISLSGATFERKPLPKPDFDRMVAERNDGQPTFEMDPMLRNRLIQIITANPQRQFVFVIAPYHPSCRMADYMPRLDSLCHELSTYKNVRIFNMGKMALDNDKYFNTSHINFDGAVLFTQAFKDSLIMAGIIRP